MKTVSVHPPIIIGKAPYLNSTINKQYKEFPYESQSIKLEEATVTQILT